MSKTRELTFDRLREVLDYCPETGAFIWKARAGDDLVTRLWNGRYAGTVAGCVNPDGYRRIRIDGVLHKASRLARLFGTGVHPEGRVDHRNRVRAGDRYANLRPATHSQNLMNRTVQIDNRLGVKGVVLLGSGKYRATIKDRGKQRHLGCFSTKQEAIAAWNKAAAELHGEFVRPSTDPDNPPVTVRIVRYGGSIPEPRSTIGPDGQVVDLEFVRYGEAVI
jgi:hypothetical protein